MRAQEAGKVLQRQECLLRRAQEAEMQAKAVEICGPALAHRREVMHSDDRLPADPLLVVAYEFDRLVLAEDIDRVVFLQLADQFEIFLQDFVRWRIPARVDDKNTKSRGGDSAFAQRWGLWRNRWPADLAGSRVADPRRRRGRARPASRARRTGNRPRPLRRPRSARRPRHQQLSITE